MPRRFTFAELVPGLFVDDGIVVKTEFDEELGEQVARRLTVIDVDDPYYGQMTRTVREHEEFEELYVRGSEAYRREVERCLAERLEYIQEAQQDIALMQGWLQP